MRTRLSAVPPLLSSVAFAMLTGCGIDSSDPAVPVPVQGVAIHGTVHGGQQPVVGAKVYLYQASTAGYGSSSTSLLNTAHQGVYSDGTNGYVLSGSDGSFTVSSDYNCSGNNTGIYLLALGGNPGNSNGNPNPALAMIASLGNCESASGIAYVAINEVSTAAAVYSLAGFMTSPTALAASSTALAANGLGNAFLTVSSLADLPSGTALSTITNGTAPQAKVNMLANIIAACVNSDGTNAACSTLLSTATSDGTSTGTKPTNTATALLNIAHNPGVNIQTLYKLVGTTPPFQPSTSPQPNDMTLSVVYTNANLSVPNQPAIDSEGNLWTVNSTGAFMNGVPTINYTLQSMSTTGVSGANASVAMVGLPSGVTNPVIDGHGNIWVGFSNAYLYKFNSGGGYTNRFIGGNSNNDSMAGGIAVDTANNIWFAAGAGLGEYANNGSVLSPSGGFGASAAMARIAMNQAISVAIDSSNNVYVGQPDETLQSGANQDGGIFTFNSAGTVLLLQDVATDPVSVAVDANQRFWVANAGAALQKENAGSYSGGGLNEAGTVAIDGGDNIWLANLGNGANSISEFSNAGVALSPSTGYVLPYAPDSAVPDGSGNIWVSSDPASTGNPSYLIKVVGIAVPVVTPLSPGMLGVKP